MMVGVFDLSVLTGYCRVFVRVAAGAGFGLDRLRNRHAGRVRLRCR
jgi:hypothetical protein